MCSAVDTFMTGREASQAQHSHLEQPLSVQTKEELFEEKLSPLLENRRVDAGKEMRAEKMPDNLNTSLFVLSALCLRESPNVVLGSFIRESLFGHS